MRTARRGVALLALLVAAGGWDALRAPDPDVARGNEAFKAGRFDEALGHYRSAEKRGVDPRLHFDLGAALYKLAEKRGDDGEKAKLFQQAEEEFRRAADTEDDRLKSSAYYNLGNAMYQRQQWEDAITAYKRALLANPQNEPARHNLEMALRQREKQPKQDQQQQGQQPKQNDQQQQGGQGQPKQNDQQQQQGQQQGQQDQQGQPGQGPQPDRQPPADQAGKQDPPDQDQRGKQRPDQGKPEQERERQRQPQQEPQRPPADENADEGPGMDSPTDQDRKLDELERRSRELRKRLLRQGGRSRDTQRLPSRKDW